MTEDAFLMKNYITSENQNLNDYTKDTHLLLFKEKDTERNKEKDTHLL